MSKIFSLMTLFLVLSLLSACGKKPSSLLVPESTAERKQIYPQTYPKVQTPPPAY
jgi:predicted small lipoprotein YifL